MSKKIATAKKYISDHKIQIVIVTAALSVAVLTQIGRHSVDKFLKEEGLYEKYYHPDADE